jgi:phosphate starvation-inducible PhoH-like protein
VFKLRELTESTNMARPKKSEPKIKPVSGVTDNHNDYIRSIVENDITVCHGPAGTGKSYISAGLAVQWLHDSRYEQVIITRPMVNAGEKIGAFPGDKNQKSEPYMGPMQENMKFFLGQSLYGHYYNNEQLRYEIFETMRGATYNNSLMILDEAQNATEKQIKMFITRMGKNSKVIINGDTNQTDIVGHSGLIIAIQKLSKVEGKGVGIIQFNTGDIQRNGILARVLAAWEA